MKSLGLFDTKNRFSEICDRVAQTGEPCTVTRRGRPLVRIVPVDETPSSIWDTVEESRRRYGPLKEEIELPSRRVRKNRPPPL